jgi:hypothetical protein
MVEGVLHLIFTYVQVRVHACLVFEEHLVKAAPRAEISRTLRRPA